MKYTLAFDVYGTLIDTSGVLHTLDELIGSKAREFMDLWRNKQLEYSFRRGLMDVFVDFSLCTAEALEYCCLFYKITLDQEQKSILLKVYRELPAFDDVEKTLRKLPSDVYRRFAFSNGSSAAVTGLLEHAGIADLFNGVVSVESTRTFKPNPRVYRYFNEKTHSTKDSALLISGNPFDVMGAISYGMRAVWVQRSPETVFDPWEFTPTATIAQLSDLPSVLHAVL